MDDQVHNYGGNLWPGCHENFQVPTSNLQSLVPRAGQDSMSEAAAKATCSYTLLDFSQELAYHQHHQQQQQQQQQQHQQQHQHQQQQHHHQQQQQLSYPSSHQSHEAYIAHRMGQCQFPEWQAMKTKAHSVMPLSKHFPSKFPKAPGMKASADPLGAGGTSIDLSSMQNLGTAQLVPPVAPLLHHFGEGNNRELPLHQQHSPSTSNLNSNPQNNNVGNGGSVTVEGGSKTKRAKSGSTAKKRKKKGEGRKPKGEKKKRTRDEESWARNKRRNARAKGESYVSVVGKVMPAKALRPVDCSKCKFQCMTHFTEEDRENFLKMYWGLETFREKVDFICKTVQEFVPIQPTTRRRSFSRRYKLTLDGKEHRVCKDFYTATFDISESTIQTCLSKKRRDPESIQDLRGRRTPANKTPEDVARSVREHILSQIGLRGSLDRPLTIYSAKKLYDHYQEECQEDEVKPASLYIYRRIFAELHRGEKRKNANLPSKSPDQEVATASSAKQMDTNRNSPSQSSKQPSSPQSSPQTPPRPSSPSSSVDGEPLSDSETRADSPPASLPQPIVHIPPHITAASSAAFTCKVGIKNQTGAVGYVESKPIKKQSDGTAIDFRQQIYRHYFSNDIENKMQNRFIPQHSLHDERLNTVLSSKPSLQPFQIPPITTDPKMELYRQGVENPSMTSSNLMFSDFTSNSGGGGGNYSPCPTGYSFNSHLPPQPSTVEPGKNISLLSVPGLNMPNILPQQISRPEAGTDTSTSNFSGELVVAQSFQQRASLVQSDNERPGIDVPKEKTVKRKRNKFPKKRTRNEDTWARNVRKRLRFKGEEYKSAKGKIVGAKKVRSVDCSKCKFKCPTKITEEQREELNTMYWQIDSYEKKIAFLVKHVQTYKPKRKMTGRRAFSRTYVFEIDGTEIRVCKNFFSATLNVSESTIATALQKSREGAEALVDRRGMHAPVNKTPDETVRNICELVIYLTGRRPHRKVEAENSGSLPKVTQMYDVYKYDNEIKGHKVASLGVFRSVLQSHFGITGMPKKKGGEDNNGKEKEQTEQPSQDQSSQET